MISTLSFWTQKCSLQRRNQELCNTLKSICVHSGSNLLSHRCQDGQDDQVYHGMTPMHCSFHLVSCYSWVVTGGWARPNTAKVYVYLNQQESFQLQRSHELCTVARCKLAVNVEGHWRSNYIPSDIRDLSFMGGGKQPKVCGMTTT